MENDKRLFGLRKFYSKNESAQKVLNFFASGDFPKVQTAEGGITVDRIVSTLNLTRNEILSVFKHLESMRFGNLMIGRRGFPSRFISFVDLASLGNAALEKTNIISPINRMETNVHTDAREPVIIQIVLPESLSNMVKQVRKS